MKRILVTGGCGFIGSNFIRQQLSEYPDIEITNLDKLTYAGNLENLKEFESNPRYQFVKGDIADPDLVNLLFKSTNFDAVINFAAESHVDRSILDSGPFVQTNIVGTQVLLDAARKAETGRYVQVSTDEVYGSLGAEGLFTEQTPLAPNSPYSASKAAADLLVRFSMWLQRAKQDKRLLPSARIVRKSESAFHDLPGMCEGFLQLSDADLVIHAGKLIELLASGACQKAQLRHAFDLIEIVFCQIIKSGEDLGFAARCLQQVVDTHKGRHAVGVGVFHQCPGQLDNRVCRTQSIGELPIKQIYRFNAAVQQGLLFVDPGE